jgi:hypothetical protein
MTAKMSDTTIDSTLRDTISLNIALKMLNYWSKQVCCCNRERRVLRAMTEDQRDAIEQYEVAVQNIAFWKKELAVEQGWLERTIGTPLAEHQRGRVAMCNDYIAKHESYRTTACYRYAEFSP